jgi:crossover junction endodeoxyribonuclease RusA
MSNTIAFTLPMPPSSNRYWRTVAYTNKRTNKPAAAVFVSDEAARYKKTVAGIVRIRSLIRSEVVLTIQVYREQRSGDLDNRLKVLCDALQGVVYANDSQIVEIHAFRFEDKKNPRVEIEVKMLGLC